MASKGLEEIPMTDEDIGDFLQEIQRQKKFSILCCGPSGAGKSTLLTGITVAKNWDGEYHVETTLDRGNSEVQEVNFSKNGITATVWDTPGLEYGENDDRFLREIKEKSAGFDLFLFCIDCTDTRAPDLFSKITDTFGVQQLWTNAVVVLTQADVLVSELTNQKETDPMIDVKAKFEDRISKWKKEVRRQLRELGYSKAKKVPVVPVGIKNEVLPGYDSQWLSVIFRKIVKVMTHDGRAAYLQLQNDRIIEDGKAPAAAAAASIGNDPFIIQRKYKIIAALGNTGVGITGAAVGAATGAAIGAAAFGVPSFGILAGVGLAVGGVVGAGVGVAASGATTMAARYYMKRKYEMSYQIPN